MWCCTCLITFTWQTEARVRLVKFRLFPCPTFNRQMMEELLSTVAFLSHIFFYCCLYLLFPLGSLWWKKWTTVFLNSLSCVEIQFIPFGQSVGDPLFIFFIVQVFLFVERSTFYYVYFVFKLLHLYLQSNFENQFLKQFFNLLKHDYRLKFLLPFQTTVILLNTPNTVNSIQRSSNYETCNTLKPLPKYHGDSFIVLEFVYFSQVCSNIYFDNF